MKRKKKRKEKKDRKKEKKALALQFYDIVNFAAISTCKSHWKIWYTETHPEK